MGAFGDFAKKSEKKKKKSKGGDTGVGFSSRPVFVPPPRLKKEKREK